MSFLRWIIFFIPVMFCFLPLYAEAGKVVRVGIYQNSPGVFTAEDGVVKGFYMDILEDTAHKEDWQLVYIAGNWPEGLERLQNGKIDLLVAIAYTTERTKIYAFNQETVFSNWGQVYVRNLEIQSILHLEGRKIAGLKGDIYTKSFSNLLESFHINHQLVETMEYRDVLKQVSTGEVEAGIVSRSNGIAIANEYEVFRSPIICCPVEIRYATRKDWHSDLRDALDRNILQLKQDKGSVYYRSLEQWFGGGGKQSFPAWLFWALAIVIGMVILLSIGIFILRHQRRIISEQLEASYSEKRMMEVKMLAASKLAAIGEVATGVAHELNQPLTYISTFTQNLELSLLNDTLNIERIKNRVTTVNQQFQRIDEIIRHLQTFGRKDDAMGKGTMQALNLAEMVEKPLLFLGERIRLRNITLERRFSTDLPPIFGHNNRLEQVFINLFQNAIHALSDREDAKIILSLDYLPTEKKVRLQFSDTGMGMESSVREKIFEPFFTTKGIGEGTGLGLSIVHGILQEHHATISCISELGKGTTFILLFPEGNRLAAPEKKGGI